MKASLLLALVTLACAKEKPAETLPPEKVPSPFLRAKPAHPQEAAPAPGPKATSRSGRPLGDLVAAGDPIRGAGLYADRCARCHGREGHGDGPDAQKLSPRPRDLTRGVASDRAYQAVLAGGPAVGRSPAMPAFGAALNDDEMAHLLVYLRKLARADLR